MEELKISDELIAILKKCYIAYGEQKIKLSIKSTLDFPLIGQYNNKVNADEPYLIDNGYIELYTATDVTINENYSFHEGYYVVFKEKILEL